MTFDTEIEVPQFVIGETISSQLNYEGMGTVLRHHSRHHVLEEMDECLITNPWLERYVQGVVLAIMLSNLVQTSSSWEEVFSVLME